MISFGANGETKNQMKKALRHSESDDLTLSGYQKLFQQIDNSKGDVTFEIANGIMMTNDFRLKPEYQSLTGPVFNAEIMSSNFSNPRKIAEEANNWSAEKTHNKITEVLKTEDITPNTRLVLLNSVYFKAQWLYPFDKKWTMDRPFYLSNGEKIKVPTMYVHANFRAGDLSLLDAQYLYLPYTSKDFSMIVIVPKKANGLQQIEDNLDKITNEIIENGNPERDFKVSMPKFKISSSIDLMATLKEMNMTDMFTDNADFSGLSDGDLKISKVIQKAFIEVNEEGSEATAVTGIEIEDKILGPNNNIVINRPFYYYIQCKHATLFQGRVVDPRQ